MFQVPPQVQAGYQQARGRVAQLWGQRPQLMKDNPLIPPAAGVGAVAVNHMLGNPVGGAVDALTLGMTNLRPDEESSYLPPTVIPGQMATPTMSFSPQGETQNFSLNAEERRRQADFLKRKIATDMLTLQTLEIQQAGDPSAR